MNKLQELIDIANKEYDGHFTLMKFTGNWRCCFGTLENRKDSYHMAYGKTMEEAIENCIKDRIDIYKVNATVSAQDILISDIHRRIHCGMKYLDCIKPTEYNNYSKRLYKFMNENPDYRFVQIPVNAKSLKEAIFTIDPMYIFKDSYSENDENELGKDGCVEGFSLESVIAPKKQFIKKRFKVMSEPYVLKHISYDFWKDYILHGKHYLSKGEVLLKELKEPKLYIMTTNKVSGIYTITNKVTGKLYIGESLDIYRRWHDEHIPQLRKNRHYNKELQNDFNKYGEENFSFEVLERYSGNDPISTKARILILESYFITQFGNAGISLYNAENSLVEILNGNKIPQEGGNTLICAIVNVLANYAIKECEGFVYFEKYKTIKSVLLDYVTLKKEPQNSVIKEFEKYLEDNGDNKYHYIHVHPVYYVINGKKLMYEEEVIRDDKIKDLEKMAILFSEYRSRDKKQEELSASRKSSDKVQYEPIKTGEVKFSLLFKGFAEKGVLPKEYIYDKVREYMTGLGLIEMKEIENNGSSKRVTFVTEDALNRKILRIVASKIYGDTLTYSYVFTVEGIEYMRKLFSDLDENKKLELFTYMNVA